MRLALKSGSLLHLSVCMLAVACLGATDETGQPSLADRANVIAPMLTVRPAAPGPVIGDRPAWDAAARSEWAKGAVARAEGLVGAPVPELNDEFYIECALAGDRVKCGPVLNARHERIPMFALAECLENQGRFLPALEDAVRLICSEKTWLHPAHDRQLRNIKGQTIEIDLSSATESWQLATAYHWLKDKLSPETKKLIVSELERRTFTPFEGAVTEGKPALWWLTTTSNWNSVCLAGVVGAALAVIESPQRRAFFVASAEDRSVNFLKGFPADGYCTEGLGYWNYGFGHYVLLCEAIRQATRGRLDLFARPGVREPAQFGARIEILNGVYPSFADCSVGTRPDPAIMWFVSRRLRLGLRQWEDYAPQRPWGQLYLTAVYGFPNSASHTPPAEKAHSGIGSRSWFSDAGVLLCRPGDRAACRLGVALKGGHNAEHHNHNDVGSYVVVVGAKALIVDPGAEVYTGRTFSKDRYLSNVLNSFGHSVPLVGGEMQIPGRDACGRVVRTDFTDAADVFVLDLSSAYAMPGLRELERTFVYSREGAGSLTVTDRVAFDEPRQFGTAIVTLSQWKNPGPGRLLIHETDEAVEVSVGAEGGELDITSEEIKEDVRTPTLPTRIGVNFKAPVRRASITITIRLAAHDGKRTG